MDPPSKKAAPPNALPAPWAPYNQRSLPARIQGLLSRANLALQPAQDADHEDERRVERRVVGLTLETELRGLASRVGAGLMLHQPEVVVCGQLLEAAGEPGRAGRLFLDAGLPLEAARLAEAAGDLETLQKALEGTHAPLEQAHAAALAFQQYETEVAARRLTQALVALERARQARPDNTAYPQLLETWRARRPPHGRLVLQGDAPDDTRTITLSPAWVGRGEDAVIRLAAMGISRRHWQVLVDEQPRVVDARGAVKWKGADGAPPSELAAGAARVELALMGAGVRLRVQDAALEAWVVRPGAPVTWNAQVAFCVEAWPDVGFPHVVVTGAEWTINGEPGHAAGSDLALGDLLSISGVGSWTVAA